MYMGMIQSVYTKILVGAVLVFVGIASGIWVGFALTESKRSIPPHSQSNSLQKKLRIYLGDIFPLLPIETCEGVVSNFEDILMGHPSVVIFAKPGCSPCEDMFNFWETDVLPLMSDNYERFICIDKADTGSLASYSHLLAEYTCVLVDESVFVAEYGLIAWPTVFTTDRFGFVTHIQAGFDSTVNWELIGP